MSDAFYLSIAAAWMWACLVFLPNNHMRVIIIGPVYVPVRVSLSLTIQLLTEIDEHLGDIGERIARIGRGMKEQP